MRVIGFFLFSLLLLFVTGQDSPPNATIDENTPENPPNVTIDDAFQNLTDELLAEIFTYNISNSGPVEKRTTRLDFLAVWLNAMRGFLADDMMNFIIDRNSEEVINFSKKIKKNLIVFVRICELFKGKPNRC